MGREFRKKFGESPIAWRVACGAWRVRDAARPSRQKTERHATAMHIPATGTN
jgi:hypothetical protein